MLLAAIIGIAPHNKLVRVIGMFRNIERRMVYDIINIFTLRTIGTAQLHSSVVRTELVLIL